VVSTKAVKEGAATIDALKEGAVDFVTKAQGMLQMESIQSEVVTKVRNAHEARQRTISHLQRPAAKAGEPAKPQAGAAPAASPPPPPKPASAPRASITILGGSAGCMQVLPTILASLPEKIVGCLVLVLKLPPFLTKQIPKQFAGTCLAPIELAESGVPLQGGRIYVAPGGDANLTFERDPTGKRVVFKLAPADKAEEGSPSIDAAMQSAAKLFREGTRGVLISGTGKDGLEGLRTILTVGGETVIQDRGSCVAPQLVIAAQEQSLAQKQLPAPEIAALLKP
jgi:two-component system chemotaxis response regulator CheB